MPLSECNSVLLFVHFRLVTGEPYLLVVLSASRISPIRVAHNIA